jgi:hypothetical protein
MKTSLILLLSLLALPLHAAAPVEVRAAARAGLFSGGGTDPVGTIELDVRRGNWSIAPAYEVIRGGYGLNAVHVDLRRLLQVERTTYWIGAGPTFVHSNAAASDTTFNIDAGAAWRVGAWEPFVAARYYTVELPVFRDTVRENGAVLSVGVSRRFR